MTSHAFEHCFGKKSTQKRVKVSDSTISMVRSNGSAATPRHCLGNPLVLLLLLLLLLFLFLHILFLLQHLRRARPTI